MDISHLKVVVIHDVLDRYGGAERVLKALFDAFPHADLIVGADTNNPQTQEIRNRFTNQDTNSDNAPTLKTTILGKLPFYSALSKFYTPLYPYAYESLDLSSYDVIISSTAHFAKAVITTPEQFHICYCHTPPRFLYHYPTETNIRKKPILNNLVSLIDHKLRMFDFIAAQRPDIIVSNSKNTARRIQKFYKRKAITIYPPVDIDRFKQKPYSDSVTLGNNSIQTDDYFLFISRLLPYKNIGPIIDAFNELNEQLIVVGEGSERKKLEQRATPNIKFTGFVTDKEVVSYMQNARGFIFNVKDEDFGIVMVEALAAGTPVIAYNGGGAKEIVQDGRNGILYSDDSKKGIISAIKRFLDIENNFDKEQITSSAQRFSKESFISQITEIVEERYEAVNNAYD